MRLPKEAGAVSASIVMHMVMVRALLGNARHPCSSPWSPDRARHARHARRMVGNLPTCAHGFDVRPWPARRMPCICQKYIAVHVVHAWGTETVQEDPAQLSHISGSLDTRRCRRMLHGDMSPNMNMIRTLLHILMSGTPTGSMQFAGP